MNILEAIQHIKDLDHKLLIYDELLAYLEKLPTGEIDLPLPDGEFLSPVAVDAAREMLQKGRSEIEEEADKLRKLDVVEPKKRRRSKSTTPNKRSRKAPSKASARS